MANRKSTRTVEQKRVGRLAAYKRYHKSPKGIAKRKLYEAKAARQAYRIRWMASPKGQAIQRRFAARRREWMQQEKLKCGCIDCGYNKHPAALDFDHVRGKKRFEVSKIKRSLKALKAEIAKCVVRCSNCHRIKTFNARQIAKDKRRIR